MMWNKRGVTLAELIIAIAVVGFIIAAAVAFNLMGEKFYQSTIKKTKVSNDAFQLVQNIGKDIRAASSVSFDGTNLTVQIPRYGGSVIETVTYTYNSSEQKIYYSNPHKGLNNVVFASNVKEFNVNISGKEVVVDLTLTIEEPQTKLKKESHHVSTFYLRN